MNAAMERPRVVQEAMLWLGTPYHHAARVRGAGVDCGQFLAAVFEDAGVIPHVEPEAYPHDWMCHRSEERYLNHVEAFAHRIAGPPLPGDIALFQWGRCISHGAIVVAWPVIIHSYVDQGVILDDAEANQELKSRLVGFWSMWSES